MVKGDRMKPECWHCCTNHALFYEIIRIWRCSIQEDNDASGFIIM